ncbi:phosphate/phosphite/phosphonate ABC transporter substrate-binding protein [Desulfopila inferna]|uniref:phosphate/phosphite/phosphonate ABC transporter substrate-binding protein n=1 Tax=Desulfopila inferna TaxID=468528 RepID=UPI0019661C20|nr:phosphate/phosphite/phosphonate ABC transporter substrate-binding protein [Desulfopila inferna]MBM9604847.1 phosphate/phosphite/phosphonate ABC transporter substrate-binding protein [Desulfopila inferna]
MSLQRYLLCALLTALFSAGVTQASEKKIRAGVASMITPVSAVRYYQQVVDYIGEKIGSSAEMVHRTTYDEIDVLLEQGEVDLAFICSSPYVLNNEKFGVELLVAPQVENKVEYHSYIIVHKDSEVDSFKDLRGSSFAFVDPKSNTGKLYPTYLLARMDQTPESFFNNFIYSYSHNKSVEIVAKNRAEGAAVDSIVYDFMVASKSPYIEQTKIIHRSPPFGIPPVVVPPTTSTFLKESLRQIFLTMHEDEDGKKILSSMRIDKFVQVPDTNYDTIRAMRAFIKNNTIARNNNSIPENDDADTENETIWIGVLPKDNPIIAYERYQPLVNYLTEATGIQTELHLEKTYKEVVNSLGKGKINFALLGPLTYLDARKRFDASPIAKSRTSRGESFFRSVIVTDTERNLDEISQLVNKKFAFSALWSTSGNLIPRYMLAWSGIHLDDLLEYQHYNYHDTVAKKVISREFDAGALRLSAAERYLPYGLKIIAVSDPIPTGPVVVSPHTPYATMRKFQKALLAIAESEEGRAILKKLDPDLQGGFVAASDADYSQIRQMINDVPKTCGKGCHPQVSF